MTGSVPRQARGASWRGAAVLLAVYVASGLLALQLATVHASASPVWPPTGIAIAGLLLVGRRFWPLIFVGAFVFNWATSGAAAAGVRVTSEPLIALLNTADTGSRLATSALIALGNTGEAVLGAALIARFCDGRRATQRVPSVLRFFAAAAAAPLVSATVGVTSLAAFEAAPWAAYWDIWATWWLGDVTGALVIAPIILAAATRVRMRRPLEHTAWTAWTLLGGGLAFLAPDVTMPVLGIAAAAMLVSVGWSALRLDARTLSVAVALWATLAVVGTLQGRGPFIEATPNASLLLLQAFVAALAISLHVLAAAAMERRQGDAIRIGPLATVTLGIVPLLLALPITGLLGELRAQSEASHEAQEVLEFEQAWAARLGAHAHLLDGAKAYLETQGNVSRAQFTQFVTSSGWLEDREVIVVSFDRVVADADLTAFQAALRADPDLPPDVAANAVIHPPGGAAPHILVDYVVPLATNEDILGLDISFNATRLQAALEAAYTGAPTASGPVRLVQDASMGFLVLVPVYRGGDPLDVAQRLDRVTGFVVAAYRTEDLVATVLAAYPESLEPTVLAVRDGGRSGTANGASEVGAVVYGDVASADASALRVALDVFGRTWTAQLAVPHGQGDAPLAFAPWFTVVVAGGLSTAFTLSGYAFESTTRRAQDLAAGMSREVQSQKEKLEEAQRIARIGSWEWDLRTNRVVWSPELYRLFDQDPAVFHPTYQDYLAAVAREDRDTAERVVRAALADRQPFRFEHRVVAKDGSMRWVESTGHVVLGEAGQVVLMAGTAQDITERHLAEERFRVVIDGAPDAILLVEEGGRIALANGEAERLLGYTRQELLGRRVEQLVPDASRAHHTALRAGYLAHPMTRPMGQGLELAVRRKDGALVPVEISLSPLRAAQGVRVVATLRDVSERRRLDAERRDADARKQEVRHLQDVNRFKTQFINTASHELRTPLMPLRTEIYLLLNDPASVPTPDQARRLRIVQRNLERLASLVEDLLTVSRQQAGRLSVEPVSMDLDRVATEAAESFTALARDRGIRLEAVPTGAHPIRADPKRISQVIYNLLSNACKFTGTGGLVRYGIEDEGDRVRMFVSDTGIGIAPQRQAELFQPFAQVHDTMELSHPGSGLGLYICRQFIEMHGGSLGVSSEGAGRGSTFWFTLPKAGPPAAAALHASDSPDS